MNSLEAQFKKLLGKFVALGRFAINEKRAKRAYFITYKEEKGEDRFFSSIVD